MRAFHVTAIAALVMASFLFSSFCYAATEAPALPCEDILKLLPPANSGVYGGMKHMDEIRPHSMKKRLNLAAVFGAFVDNVLKASAAKSQPAPQFTIVDLFAGPGIHINKKDKTVSEGSPITLLQVCCEKKIYCNFFVSDLPENVAILAKVLPSVMRGLKDKKLFSLVATANSADALLDTDALLKSPDAVVFINVDPYGFNALPLTLAAKIARLVDDRPIAAMQLHYFAAGGYFRAQKKSVAETDMTPWLGVKVLNEKKGVLAILRKEGAKAFLQACKMIPTSRAVISSGKRAICDVFFAVNPRAEKFGIPKQFIEVMDDSPMPEDASDVDSDFEF